MESITYLPIGVIHTPWTEMIGMPVQSVAAEGVAGTIGIMPEYVQGLRDVEGFSHLILLYHLHRITGYALDVTPYLDTATHGIFATRSPKRPNPIGFSTVEPRRHYSRRDLIEHDTRRRGSSSTAGKRRLHGHKRHEVRSGRHQRQGYERRNGSGSRD